LQAKPVDPALLLRAAQHVLNRTDVIDVTPAAFSGCRLFTGAGTLGFGLLAAAVREALILTLTIDD